ncbi:MAG: YraN family protein [Cellvibrionales bacterium]|nr:YraN family protein [Cellvibrionales bacterium]
MAWFKAKKNNVRFSSLSKTKSIGDHFETLALEHLKKQGLRLIEQNVRSRFGEIDLIMKEKQTLCFIEVRYRKKTSHGGAISSVTPNKQQRIIKTAQTFLQKNPAFQAAPCRFDVLAISQNNDTNDINWIKSAFY